MFGGENSNMQCKSNIHSGRGTCKHRSQTCEPDVYRSRNGRLERGIRKNRRVDNCCGTFICREGVQSCRKEVSRGDHSGDLTWGQFDMGSSSRICLDVQSAIDACIVSRSRAAVGSVMFFSIKQYLHSYLYAVAAARTKSTVRGCRKSHVLSFL